MFLGIVIVLIVGMVGEQFYIYLMIIVDDYYMWRK